MLTSVLATPLVTSFSAPPFSVTSSRPSGRNAIAVGVESEPTTCVSAKPVIGVPACAVPASVSSASAMVVIFP